MIGNIYPKPKKAQKPACFHGAVGSPTQHTCLQAPNIPPSGAMLEEVPQPGQGPKIKGSAMLVYADSKEEVERMLKEDIYTKSNVWDWKKVS